MIRRRVVSSQGSLEVGEAVARLLSFVRKPGILVIATMGWMLAGPEAFATQVTLRLVDQIGTGVAGAAFSIAGQPVDQDSSVILAPGIYPLTVMPAINGQFNEGHLMRVDTVTVGIADTTITRVWHYADLTVRLEDQFGAADDSATFSVPALHVAKEARGEPTYRLPVTVEQPGEPPYSNTFAGGYDVGVMPSINGLPSGGHLNRVEAYAELDTGGLVRTFVWKRADLTVRLVDQNDTPDDSATFSVPALPLPFAKEGTGEMTYRLPVTVEQPGEPAYSNTYAGGYDVRVMPSINGLPNGGHLNRVEAYAELDTGGLVRTFVWRRADLTVRLVDQNNTPDDSATFSVPASYVAKEGAGEATFRLPVTVEQPGEPAYSNTFAGGYDVRVMPSINGLSNGGHLFRVEVPAELDTGGLMRTFVWKRADLTMRLVDQNGIPDDSATFLVPALPARLATERTGEPTYRLPVTVEQPGEPEYSNTFASGYNVRVTPSINGQSNGAHLNRLEAYAELDTTGLERTLVWRRASGPLRIVDSTLTEVTGSAFILGSIGPSLTGTGVSLPVSEDTTHATIDGDYALGYPGYIRPGPSGSFAGGFALELLSDGSFDPDLVTIEGTRYGLSFDLDPPQIQEVVPNAGGAGGDAGGVTLTLAGHNLQSGATVRLSRSGQPNIAGSHVVADGLSLEAIFDLRGAEAGAWDVVVVNPDSQSAALANGFTIETAAPHQLRVNVIGPALMRPNRPKAFDVVIENFGNSDVLAVPLWILRIPLDADVGLGFPLAPPPQAGGEPDWSLAPLTLTGPAGQYLPVIIPRLRPGVTVRRIFLTVPETVTDFELDAAITPRWEDGTVFRACLSGAGVISNPACMGAQLTEINAYLAQSAGLQAVSGIGLWAKIAWQCEGAGDLAAALASAEQVLDLMLEPVEGTGVAAGCADALLPQWQDRHVVGIVTSVDPNDKLGIPGNGPGRQIALGQPLIYSIRFENGDIATAPAQNVVVIDNLNPATFDLSTVSLTSIQFGMRADGSQWCLYPPPGRSSYGRLVDLRPDLDLQVQVSVSLDPAIGRLSWAFTSFSADSLGPPGEFEGFLPPNLTPTEGEGSLLFTVMPRNDIGGGTVILNQASIQFDDADAVFTPEWSNTIDDTPPESQVLPLSATQDSASFTVGWELVSPAPDLHDYSVYVSEDGGAYRPWRMHTVATADTFSGQGHHYAFYSLAQDSSGNMEEVPPVPDAETTSLVAVGRSTGLTLRLEGAIPNPSIGGVRVWFTLPRRGRAILEVMDVAGRRMAQHDVGALGPGRHSVDLSAAVRRPGLYFLRLAQGGKNVYARVVALR